MGIRYGITSLRLAGSVLEIRAECAGPLPELENAPVTVFGEDGQGFCQGEGGPGYGVTCRAVGEGETSALTLRLKMDVCL